MLLCLSVGDGKYDIDEYMFLMYLKWNDHESVQDIKEAFNMFDKVSRLSLHDVTKLISLHSKQ